MADIGKRAVSIIKSEKRMTGSERLAIFAGALIAEHAVVACICLALPCYPLMAVNLAAIALEFFVAYFVRKKGRGYFWGISVIYFVSCFQPLAASVLLGWTYGFGLYNPAMIPVLFYMAHMTEENAYPRWTLAAYTLINCICTLTVRRYVYARLPIYVYTAGTDSAVSFINNVICFGLAIVFSSLFIRELDARQKELGRQTENLRFLANYDSLTRLRNRRSMLDIWKNLNRRDYCVIMSDIDDFKKINDTYGHEQGDEALRLVADSLRSAVGSADHVSRWGGEEFLMLVFGDLSYALQVADQVRRRLREADITAAGERISVTLTFGISECTDCSAGDVDELIRQADRRLYIGKKNGKNCIVTKDE